MASSIGQVSKRVTAARPGGMAARASTEEELCSREGPFRKSVSLSPPAKTYMFVASQGLCILPQQVVPSDQDRKIETTTIPRDP